MKDLKTISSSIHPGVGYKSINEAEVGDRFIIIRHHPKYVNALFLNVVVD